jgi:hypothetical protein
LRNVVKLGKYSLAESLQIVYMFVLRVSGVWKLLPFSAQKWFQRFKINLWLKTAIDSLSRANQFELGSDPDSVS